MITAYGVLMGIHSAIFLNEVKMDDFFYNYLFFAIHLDYFKTLKLIFSIFLYVVGYITFFLTIFATSLY